MKITDVKTYFCQGHLEPLRWIFVEVETDEGVVGLGDGTNWPHGEIVVKAIEALKPVVVGQDPFNIEMLWNQMYRALYPMGVAGVAISAISGIETALWDIVGQACGQPIYTLLGGRCYDSIRLYANSWFHDAEFTPAGYARAAERIVGKGFTALKFDPLPRSQGRRLNMDVSREEARFAYEMVKDVRKAVGPDVDIALDMHARMNTESAIRVCRMMEELDPLFIEEPVPPENAGPMARVREAVKAPICTGERLWTRYGFRELLERNAVDIVMPDIVRTGGISEGRKIAAMASTYYVSFAPHNPNSPVASLVSLHTCIGVPNFLILEFISMDVPWRDEVLTQPLRLESGHLLPPEGPGLGTALNKAALKKHMVQV